jgi:hypothetical protein
MPVVGHAISPSGTCCGAFTKAELHQSSLNLNLATAGAQGSLRGLMQCCIAVVSGRGCVDPIDS